MSYAFANLPSHIRLRLANALDGGHLSDRPSLSALQAALGSLEYVSEAEKGITSLGEMGINGRAAGAWLLALERARETTRRPDVVWSGPPVDGLNARDTRQVYEDMLRSAKESVWASTYAFFDGPRAFSILASRMEAVPHLRVRLLLNIQRHKGDTSAGDQVVRRFANQFWGHDWPGSVRPAVYYDPRSVELEGPRGVLHAKALVVDESSTFITSANLTEAALDSNVELGVLYVDRGFALTVSGYFQGLIDRGLLSLLPLE